MPRDSSGVYTLPAGNPVVDGTIIETSWANPTMSDIAVQLNNVLTRDGLLGPTAPVRFTDGTVAEPSISFGSQPNLGFYREAASTLSVSVGGAKIAQWGTTGLGMATGKTITAASLKVGEGAASPSQKLAVNTPSGTAAGLQLFQDGNESWVMQIPASSTGLTWSSSGVERMRIQPSGSVQIGTSSAETVKLLIYDNSVNAAAITRQDGTGPVQLWRGPGGGEVGRVTNLGRATFGGEDTARAAVITSIHPGAGGSNVLANMDDVSFFAKNTPATGGANSYRTVFTGQVYTNSDANQSGVQIALVANNSVGSYGAGISMVPNSGGALAFSTGSGPMDADQRVGFERMRIAANGIVTLFGADLNQALQIYSNNESGAVNSPIINTFNLNAGEAQQFVLTFSGQSVILGNRRSGGDLLFQTNDVSRLAVKSDGGVIVANMAGGGNRQVMVDNNGRLYAA
jgi:hypothetical protein